MSIRFGPAGLGSVDEAISNLENIQKNGLRACEISFTYGVYIKDKEKAEEIRDKAKKLDIKLSIHAPYWINLNSKEKQKIEDSKKRILSCCEVGDWLGAKKIVFHPGYYSQMDKDITYTNIRIGIEDIQDKIKEKGFGKIILAPETTGKINVFGKEDEILKLVRETKCGFTVDFSHLLARSLGKESYENMYEKFKKFKELHCHFSGIEWTDKGEKRHIITSKKEITKLLSVFPRQNNITIINESPSPLDDSVKSLDIWKSL